MIPYSVDASFDRRPVANWLIFAGLIIAYLLQTQVAAEQIERLMVENMGFLWLIGHNWLHMHIVFLVLNLLFLWPLGNAVCAEIGNKRYIWLYFVSCFVGGLVHLLVDAVFDIGPGFGPSIAINCITGIYIVFFPENSVNVMFFFPRPVTVEVSSYFIVGLWLVFDLLAAIVGVRGIFYVGHLLAFAGGIYLGILALKKKWVVRQKDETSLLQIIDRMRKGAHEVAEEIREARGVKERKPEIPDDSVIMEAIKSDSEQARLEKAVARMKQEKRDNYIRFYCDCGKRIKVPPSFAGRTGRCPGCSALIRVPEK